MNVSVRKRARQRAQLMQAELDGQAIAPAAFIAPVQLKPDLHLSDHGAVWFGVWNGRRGPGTNAPCEAGGARWAITLPVHRLAAAGGIDRDRAADDGSKTGSTWGCEEGNE
jgi:hypothetical protein